MNRRSATRLTARPATALLAAVLALPVLALEQPVEAGPALDAGSPAATRRPLWELGLGVAGLRLPDYLGSDQHRNYLLPLPYFVYRGTWLKADRDGARAVLLDVQRVKVDVSLAATTPTRSNRNLAREGMPNLSGTGEVGPNLDIALAESATDRWKLHLRLPARAAVTIERSPKFVGATFSPNLNLDLGGAEGEWNLGMLTGPVFASRKFNRYYYGVDPAYATAARPAYEAHGGYAGWRAVTATSRRFGNAWVGAFLRYDSLRGAAFTDSPLVRRRSELTFGLGVSWILATSRELVASDE